MKIKAWAKQQWLRFKNWVIGILIAIGLVSVPIIGMSGDVTFRWTNPTLTTDGSVFNPETDQANTKIYCTDTGDGTVMPTIIVPGAVNSYVASLPSGDYECYATVTSVEGAESFASNTVTKTVDPLIPNPPVLDP